MACSPKLWPQPCKFMAGERSMHMLHVQPSHVSVTSTLIIPIHVPCSLPFLLLSQYHVLWLVYTYLNTHSQCASIINLSSLLLSKSLMQMLTHTLYPANSITFLHTLPNLSFPCLLSFPTLHCPLGTTSLQLTSYLHWSFLRRPLQTSMSFLALTHCGILYHRSWTAGPLQPIDGVCKVCETHCGRDMDMAAKHLPTTMPSMNPMCTSLFFAAVLHAVRGCS